LRIFVTEYVCGGGWPEHEIAGSLAVEGRAMLCAIVEDLSTVSGVHVVTTWDARLGPHPFRDVEASVAEREPLLRQRQLEELSSSCDATLLIAPEFDGILFDLCRSVEVTGGKLLGPGSAAVERCADKLQLASVLQDAGVPTIPTRLLSWGDAPPRESSEHELPFPVVVKPRDGAGSQCNHLIKSRDDFERVQSLFGAAAKKRSYIWQPFVAGQAVSMAVLISEAGEGQAYPVAEQFQSNDGRFFYWGGRIPARDVDKSKIQAAALAACRCVPGLRGYVGIDLIVPADERSQPIVVEINPRLTTSYLGYRELALENLAERMLPGQTQRPIKWQSSVIEFDAAGGLST
jgi:predicted ATP-grasp superfamily ATP-dependent carboligase